MNNDFRDRQQKSYTIMRMIYDITMAILFLSMAMAMFFADRLNINQIVAIFDKTFRYFFGAICLLYGAFRVYRAIKKDY